LTEDRDEAVRRPPSTVLVLTSGNLSEEPIATDNDDARARLFKLADAFLMHNRDIHIRCDDSVVRVFDGRPLTEDRDKTPSTVHRPPSIYPIRRSRGYSPFPVKLPFEVPQILAAGSELKNTFCITNGNYTFLSHHIGDMENYETLKSFEQGVVHFEGLFRVKPEAIAHDLHPNYLATRYALERAEREGLPTFAVQHHHAHVAACMAEHGLDGSRPVIGLAFDGTGYGEDGAIWGGEILVADYKAFQRRFHLEYFPLPGGDAAIKKPARTALALLWSLGLEWDERLDSVKEFCAQDRNILRAQLEKKINTPLTSSMGRLFDAAAALAGVRQSVNYEGQAAIEFEALADSAETGKYPFGLNQDKAETRTMLEALIKDVMGGVSPSKISAKFHNGLADLAREACLKIKSETGISEVALSGGVWQNMTLLQKTAQLLEADGFKIYIHHEVPTNDGGLSLGQAMIAASKIRP
jgi:hydrogenase maturation protein HypF